MRSTSITELMNLAEQTGLDDTLGLAVLGQCVLVCTLLDPDTPPELKKKIAMQIARQTLKSGPSDGQQCK